MLVVAVAEAGRLAEEALPLLNTRNTKVHLQVDTALALPMVHPFPCWRC